MGRLNLTPTSDTSVFRKIAMGTWQTAKDPTVYGLLEIDMKPVQGLLDSYSKKHGVKITPSQLVGRALALSIKETMQQVEPTLYGQSRLLYPSRLMCIGKFYRFSSCWHREKLRLQHFNR